MEAYSGDASILFLAVCDEEETSAGARAAAPMLKNMEKQFGLEIKLVINLDAISDQGDGSNGRVVTYGSIGKLLLTAFVHGKQTHAGYPQDGVNAAYVAAELLTEFELSPVAFRAHGRGVGSTSDGSPRKGFQNRLQCHDPAAGLDLLEYHAAPENGR